MKIEDFEIIKRYKSGQTKLMEYLVHKYKNTLYKLCFHLTNNKYESEDLFQNTWMKVIDKIDTFDEKKEFKNWLYTITVNLYRDNYRRKKRWLNRIVEYFSEEKKENDFSKVKSSYGNPEKDMELNMEKQKMLKIVNNMDDKYKVPIILYYFKEMNQKDISIIMDIPVGTVKSRLNYAKMVIKEEWGGNYG